MKIIALIFLLFCASCVSNDKVIKTLTESSGKLEISIKGDEWVSIKSVGTAKIIKDQTEQAMNVAVLRAKANIAEFFGNQIVSDKSFKNITSKDKDTLIVITEDIKSKTSQVLKFTRVVDRKIVGDYVFVAVEITKNLK